MKRKKQESTKRTSTYTTDCLSKILVLKDACSVSMEQAYVICVSLLQVGPRPDFGNGYTEPLAKPQMYDRLEGKF